MGINKKCPKCGSTKVQLSDERNKHGFLWLLLFGVFYISWWCFKLMIAAMLFCCVDWWMAIVNACQNEGYVWVSKRVITNRTKIYYCHDCGNNFRA